MALVRIEKKIFIHQNGRYQLTVGVRGFSECHLNFQSISKLVALMMLMFSDVISVVKFQMSKPFILLYRV